MTKELEVKESIDGVSVTENEVIEYCKSFLTNKLNDNEIKQFVKTAVTFNLNPVKREIYCIAYGQGSNRKLSILTGYEVYLKRADRLHVLDGWNVMADGTINNGSLKAVITIYRKDWKYPFVHEVYFNEYNQNNHIWKTKPFTMIKKVAVAQGFRLAFPDEFGGMPYTSDEMSDNMANEKTINQGDEVKEKIVFNELERKKDKMMLNAFSLKDDMTQEERDHFRNSSNDTDYNQEKLDRDLKLVEEIRKRNESTAKTS